MAPAGTDGRAEDGAETRPKHILGTNQKKERALKKNLETLASGLREDIAQFDGTVARISGTEGTSPYGVQSHGAPRTRRRRTSTLFSLKSSTDDGLTLSGDELLEVNNTPKHELTRARAHTHTHIHARTHTHTHTNAHTHTSQDQLGEDLLSTGNSLLLRRIADRLGFVGIWALLVTLFSALSPPEWGVQERISVPAWPTNLWAVPVHLARVSHGPAYQRFWEGRAMWADVAGYVRSMAIIAVTVLDGEQRNVFSRTCVCCPWF